MVQNYINSTTNKIAYFLYGSIAKAVSSSNDLRNDSIDRYQTIVRACIELMVRSPRCDISEHRSVSEHLRHHSIPKTSCLRFVRCLLISNDVGRRHVWVLFGRSGAMVRERLVLDKHSSTRAPFIRPVYCSTPWKASGSLLVLLCLGRLSHTISCGVFVACQGSGATCSLSDRYLRSQGSNSAYRQ